MFCGANFVGKLMIENIDLEGGEMSWKEIVWTGVRQYI